ncbi:HD domain-containing protein [Carboxylicivirga sp. M1479]|uniref:HD domain-containing protein n=1 Tax=Carboxylicivirga sp. M1479 TaxID=2594476 RepID=UPI0011783434|nr:HD domain-containing protein [Carboxylicivirga sp. M1479]TRX70241.1 hydrolase [Carboxylicivirga sp. M1479]
MSYKPNRKQALDLFLSYNKTDSLYRHALAVEAVMRHFARLNKEDEDKWGIIGLMHDLDYEMYPDEHCIKTKAILQEANWPDDYIRAILSHAWGICTDIEPKETMEKVLYACDELTGLVTTATLVRPDKSIHSLTIKSLKKRWKDKRFAAKVDRNIISKGADLLNMPIEQLMEETIKGMQGIADDLGLSGIEK